MPSFLQIPADMPWWVALAIVVPGAIYGLLLLAMPFGVFGLKSRLDQIEGQLEDIRIELRAIASGQAFHTGAPPEALGAELEPTSAREEGRAIRVEPVATTRVRAEPRLDWRR